MKILAAHSSVTKDHLGKKVDFTFIGNLAPIAFMELDPGFRGLLDHLFRIFRSERRIPAQQDICNYSAWYPSFSSDTFAVNKVAPTPSTIRQQPCCAQSCSVLRAQHNRSCPPWIVAALLESAGVLRC